MRDPEPRYRENLERAELNALLHYGHPIPACCGLTDAYVATRYPGWTWNELIAILRAAGIVVRPLRGAPLRCDPRVRRVHVTSPSEFEVDWADQPE
jgi:hypothetical protein